MLRIYIVFFLTLMPLCAHSAEHKIISKVYFVGNDVTQEYVLHREMYIHRGDKLDVKKIASSIQALMDLNIFKQVKYILHDDTSRKNKVSLEVIVEEKVYKLLIPRARYENNQWRTGLQFRWDNVNGLNHRLKLVAERIGSEQGVSELRQRFKYIYPNILGSDYYADIDLVNQNIVDKSIDEELQNQRDQYTLLGVFKWLNDKKIKLGWYSRIGLDLRRRDFESLETQQILSNSNALEWSVEYGYKKVHTYMYNRGGKHYGYKIRVANSALGSQSEYIANYLFYQSYYGFKSRPDENLNVRTVVAYSTDNVLGDRAFILDYKNGLRGYERARYQGNSMLLMNIEYLKPSIWYRSLRFVYFIDLGSTGNTLHDAFNGELKVGVGFGLRWKIPALVRVDLRVDIGYGVSDDNTRVTVGTRHMF